MSVTIVCVVWILLSTIVTVSYWCTLLQPFWFVHPRTMTSFGIYSYCTSTTSDDGQQVVRVKTLCRVYGEGRFHFSLLPSAAWQVTCVLIGCASVLMSVATFMTLLTLCVLHRCNNIAIVTGYVQVTAAILYTVGLTVLPTGLGATTIQQHCGDEASSYWPGACIVGWSCVLAVVADSLAAFCPFLSHHEWNNFLQELYDAVDQQLKESHVPSFSDLTDAERVMFIERARNAIQGGLSYGKLYGQVSSILDRDLNKAVSRQQIEDLAAETKTDLILDCALDGSVGLLNKWPDLRSKLHAFLNHPLPQQLRPVAWRLYLEDSKSRRKYLQTLATDPWSAVSSLDRDISNTCEELLKIDEFLDEFQGSVGVFYAMKAVLSYYHALKCGADPLHRTYYNLIFPFILVSTPSLPRKEPAPSHIVALLTEEYFTFTSSLPHFIHNTVAKVDDHSANVFASRVASCLKSINADIDLSLTSNLFFQNEDNVSRESVETKDSVRKTGNQTILTDTVQSLVIPVVQNMFVGYVQRDVLLYIWDQYIIGLDSSGFTDDYLPAITAVFLKLADDRVKASKPVKTTLAKEGKKLTVAQFQYEMNKHFHDELFARLKQEARAALPVLDPTQAIDQRWLKWFDDQTIQNVTPTDHRSQLKIKHTDNRNKSEFDSKSLHRSQLQDQQLPDKLAQERRRREDGERIAAQEISRLRRELDELNRQKVRNLSSSTPVSTTSHLLIVPPPTAASHPSPTYSPYQSQPADAELRTPRHQTPPKQTSTAMTDFLKRVVKGFDRVANGEGYQKEQLDKKTRKSVKNHREDLKNAEIVIFGHELVPGEFEQLPEATQQEKTHDMMELIHKQMIERRKQQLTAGVR